MAQLFAYFSELVSDLNCSYLLSAAVLGLVILYLVSGAFGRKWPPGPTFLPGLGVVPGLVGGLKGREITKWTEQYNSNIFCIKIMGQPAIILSSFPLIKEVLGKTSLVVDRQPDNAFAIFEKNYPGIIFESGEIWRESRKTILRMMKEVGMTRSKAEDQIAEEAQRLIKKILEFEGKEFDAKDILFSAVSNVTNSFVFGKTSDYDDPKFSNVLNSMRIFAKDGSGIAVMFVMQYKLGRMILSDKYNHLNNHFTTITDFVDEQIEEHTEKFDGSVNDVVDALLNENVGRETERFSRERIRGITVDMFGAGSDTTVSQISWLLLYMAAYPDVQEKVYRELEDFYSNRSENPSFHDKKFIPFTEAVICEVMRVNVLLDLGLPHTNVEQDFEINGYTIPKNTPVFQNLWGIQNDPKTFPDPEKFDPNHFLNDKGEVINQDHIVTFSIGKRSCIGEPLARVEIFMFFVILMLKFRVELPSGAEVDLNHGDDIGMNQAPEHLIKMIPR